MATYVIRSAGDVFTALQGINAVEDDLPVIRFDGFPRILITVPEGIGAGAATAINKIQKLVRREYCYWRHGTTNLSKLTASDKRRTELHVEFPHPTQMLMDFSRAATAMADAVRVRCATSGADLTGRLADLFSAKPKWGAVRDVGLAIIRKATPEQVAKLAMTSIIVTGLVWSAPTLWRDYLHYSVEMQTEENAHQLRLAELERTKIIGGSGAAIASTAHQTAERELEFDSQRIRKLLRAEYQGPFARFLQFADAVRPALLGLARDSTIDFDGVTINAGAARFAARALKSDPDYGWKAVVHATKAIES